MLFNFLYWLLGFIFLSVDLTRPLTMRSSNRSRNPSKSSLQVFLSLLCKTSPVLLTYHGSLAHSCRSLDVDGGFVQVQGWKLGCCGENKSVRLYKLVFFTHHGYISEVRVVYQGRRWQSLAEINFNLPRIGGRMLFQGWSVGTICLAL